MLPRSIQILIDELHKLPGIGPKSAERLVFHLLRQSDREVEALAGAVKGLKDGVNLCPQCFQFANSDLCSICADATRDRNEICVVETILDLMALERTNEYRGLYHVLHGRIDPLHGIGPEQIKLRELKQRLQKDGQIREIILATDPDIEGEATAMYIADLLKDLPVRISRLARGLPSGGNIEFADDMTLRSAFRGRTSFSA